MSDTITNYSKKYDPYEGMIERYNLSFASFGEQDPQMSEFSAIKGDFP